MPDSSSIQRTIGDAFKGLPGVRNVREKLGQIADQEAQREMLTQHQPGRGGTFYIDQVAGNNNALTGARIEIGEETINGWVMAPASPDRATVVFYGGSDFDRSNVNYTTAIKEMAEQAKTQGMGFAVFDYPETLNEETVKTLTTNIQDHLVQNGVPLSQQAYAGYSQGSFPAIYSAANNPEAQGLQVISGFSSAYQAQKDSIKPGIQAQLPSMTPSIVAGAAASMVQKSQLSEKWDNIELAKQISEREAARAPGERQMPVTISYHADEKFGDRHQQPLMGAFRGAGDQALPVQVNQSTTQYADLDADEIHLAQLGDSSFKQSFAEFTHGVESARLAQCPANQLIAGENLQNVLNANDQANSRQASETFQVNAADGRALTDDGQTLGFAKRQLGTRTAELNETRVQTLQAAREVGVPVNTVERLTGWSKTISTSQAELERPGADISPEAADGMRAMIGDLQGKRVRMLDGLEPHQLEPTLQAVEAKTAYEASAGADTLALGPAAHIAVSPEAVQDGMFNSNTLLGRAVACSEIDQLIGTNVLSHEKYAIIDDQLVGVSVAADGGQALKIEKVTNSNEVEHEVSTILRSPDDKNLFAQPEVQKGLYDLECMDYLTGQVDRHPGNIVIDQESGKVTGIDNDMALPHNSRDDYFKNPENFPKSAVGNLPRYMHEDTAEKILQTSPDDLRRAMSQVPLDPRDSAMRPALSEQEIEGAVQRLGELKAHIGELREQGRVVTQFTDETYDEAMDHHLQHVAPRTPDGSAAIGAHRHHEREPLTSYIGALDNAAFEANEIARSSGFEQAPSHDGGPAPRNEEYAQQRANLTEVSAGLADNQNLSEVDQQKLTTANANVDRLQDKFDNQVREMNAIKAFNDPNNDLPELEQAHEQTRRELIGVTNSRDQLVETVAAKHIEAAVQIDQEEAVGVENAEDLPLENLNQAEVPNENLQPAAGNNPVAEAGVEVDSESNEVEETLTVGDLVKKNENAGEGAPKYTAGTRSI